MPFEGETRIIGAVLRAGWSATRRELNVYEDWDWER